MQKSIFSFSDVGSGIVRESLGLAGTTFTHRTSYQFAAQLCVYEYFACICVCAASMGQELIKTEETTDSLKLELQMLGIKPCSSAREASSLNY